MKIVRPIEITEAALTFSTAPAADYGVWSSASTYALGARVTYGSPPKNYESLQAANLNHNPATALTWWLDIGATNRWKMFDESVSAQTVIASALFTHIQATGRVNAVAIMNVDCVSILIQMIDVVDGAVYSEEYSLISTAGIVDWYSYFFEPITRLHDLVILDLPTYYSPLMQISFYAWGETVRVGELVLGQQIEVGGTQYGAGVGITDYSVKTQDAFGNYTLLERAFRKRATFALWVPYNKVDQLHELLTECRASPTLYIGSDLYTSSMVYGFYKDFYITIQRARESLCNIELEGLT